MTGPGRSCSCSFLPAAIGHLCHFVLLINIVSGLGYPEATMDRVRFWLFAALWVSSGVLLWMHLNDPFWNWPWPLFELCHPLRLLGRGRLAARLALPRAAETARGDHRTSPDDRPGTCEAAATP